MAIIFFNDSYKNPKTDLETDNKEKPLLVKRFVAI